MEIICWRKCTLWTLLLIVGLGSHSMAAIVLDRGYSYASRVSSSSGSSGAQSVEPSTIPFTQSFFISDNGQVASNFALGDNGMSVTFAYDMSFGSRSGIGMTIFFHTTEDLLYTISGSSLAGIGHAMHYLEVQLSRRGGGELYLNIQNSTAWSPATYSSVPETFTVGETGGYRSNALSGSATGLLSANTGYVFSAGNRVSTTAGASGSGNIFIHFSPVPEPSAFVLVAMMLLLCSSHVRTLVRANSNR